MSTVSALPSITDSAAAQAANSASTTASNSQNSLANQTTFLQLLVSELKNQDPSQPVDGTAFVTQLATINDVQQNLAMRQDLDAVSAKYLGTTTAPSQSSGSTSTSGSSSISS